MENLITLAHRLPLSIVLGILIAVLLIWIRLRNRASRRMAPLPEGCAFVCHEGVPREDSSVPSGTLMLIGVGSYGVKQLLRLLVKLEQANLAGVVGSILAIESDKMQRGQFTKQLPPIFEDRVVLAYVEHFSGGFSNKPVEWVREHVEDWIIPIQTAAKQIVQLHKRLNDGRPAEIVPFLSLGGHAYVGVVALDKIHELLPDTQIVGCVDLPVDEELRANFLEVKPAYERSGVVGWLLSDSLGPDWVSADSAMIDFLAGMLVAGLQSDHTLRLNNVLSRTLPKQQGGILIYEFIYSEVAAHPIQPAQHGGPAYYVNKDQLIDEVQRLRRQIAEGKGIYSAVLPVGENGRTTYDLMLVAVGPEDLLAIGDHVALSYESGQRFRNGDREDTTSSRQENYHLLFASCSPPINPERPACRVAAIRLQAVRDGACDSSDIIKVPRKRNRAEDPNAVLVAPQPKSTNGVEQTATRGERS